MYALLVKKDHAAAGKIVVLMGAVGTIKPEAEAAKDLEKFATPLTMSTLGDMSYAEIGKQLRRWPTPTTSSCRVSWC